MLSLCEILEVEGVDSRKVKSALNRRDFKDLEDCIQDECAAAIKADYIVTRNKKDFEIRLFRLFCRKSFLIW